MIFAVFSDFNKSSLEIIAPKLPLHNPPTKHFRFVVIRLLVSKYSLLDYIFAWLYIEGKYFLM